MVEPIPTAVASPLRFGVGAGPSTQQGQATEPSSLVQEEFVGPTSAPDGGTRPAIAAMNPGEILDKLNRIVEELNDQAKRNGRDLGFSIDERLDRSIVTVRNSVSGEVVRQLPSEVVLRVGNHIEDLKGILFDEEF